MEVHRVPVLILFFMCMTTPAVSVTVSLNSSPSILDSVSGWWKNWIQVNSRTTWNRRDRVPDSCIQLRLSVGLIWKDYILMLCWAFRRPLAQCGVGRVLIHLVVLVETVSIKLFLCSPKVQTCLPLSVGTSHLCSQDVSTLDFSPWSKPKPTEPSESRSRQELWAQTKDSAHFNFFDDVFVACGFYCVAHYLTSILLGCHRN